MAVSDETVLPYTGHEFLDSLDDGREVWIYGQRVGRITNHPAFRNTARMIARLYDALHDDHNSGHNILTCPSGAVSLIAISSLPARSRSR
jgi:4-hydroxyphenylacetate 3-monooxygenase